MSQERLLKQGIEHCHKREYESAETKFRAALDTYTENHVEIKFRLAFCLEMQEKLEASESLYLQVATADGPSSIVGDALYRIGWMAMNQKDHTKAISYYKEAATVLKDSPNAQHLYKECIYWLALSCEAVGQIIKALNIYERIATDNVWFWDVAYRKIKCFDTLGRYKDALACCRKFKDNHRAAGDAVRAKELYPSVDRIERQLDELIRADKRNL